jgi:hypothetical protein
MVRYHVEDWRGTDLLRIVDTASTTFSHVVGYVEAAIKAEDDTDSPWCAWFRSFTNIQPFQPTDNHPDGKYAEFPSKEQAIAAVEALAI